MADRKPHYHAVMDAPFGRIGIRVSDAGVSAIDPVSKRVPLQSPETILARQACRELARYFADPLFRFTVRVDGGGTAFRQRVWKAMARIPVGQVLSYGALARKLTTAPRAVGGACAANPVPIIVPCHRVVGVDGIGGYMGQTHGAMLDMKRWLLNHEAR
jgi:methylated-DNA-[protein]-cysteine S-methyltransferase